MNTKHFTYLSAIFLLLHFPTMAQLKMPQASPASKVTQQVGLSTIELEYSRPSMKNRKIFGELVAFGQVWRTGANAATTIQFDTEVTLNGNQVEPGKYALFTIPDKKRWTIILSKNTELWGAVGYDETTDEYLRFTVPAEKNKKSIETMEINFSELTDSGATLAIQWAKTKAKFRIETEVDPIVMKQIQEMVIDKEPNNPGIYYQAANYYFNTGKDLNLALEWIEKSVEADPKYWTLHLKAKIENSMDMKEEAKASAMKSMEMAREAKNLDYVSLNERLIKSIK
jgi:hypothetical protein